MPDEDKLRGLSPYDLRRILGDPNLAGVKILLLKADGTFEYLKSDDAGRALTYDPQIAKLAGVAPAKNTVNANWNSGVAPSGQPGATLVTIGAAATRYKVHGLHVDVTALTAGATVTVRLYTPTTGVAGVNCYSQNFVVGTDPNDLWIINGTLEIDDILRVEVRSSIAGDDGRAVGYKYLLEAM